MAYEIADKIGVQVSPRAEVENDEVGKVPARVGELGFEEYTQGGLGRHLGVFSTILLMFATLPQPPAFGPFICSDLRRIVSAASLGQASSPPLPQSPAAQAASVPPCFSGFSDFSLQAPVSPSGLSWAA